MELATAERQVQTGGDLGFQVDYMISLEDVAHIMWVLRTGLYTRKALAVLREYGANAWDEHQQAGIGDRPIKVHVPTWVEPYFTVRDFGRGLDRQGIQIFAKFGASTKRGAKADCQDCHDLREETGNPEAYCPACTEAIAQARKAVGALGIGSKAGFCIGDTFTVTSWHAGTKSIYRSAIGEDNKGKMTLMHEEPCGDETGIEIKVPSPQAMVWEFEREACDLFRYMRPQPEINMYLTPTPEGLEHGFLYPTNRSYTGASSWIGVMGCVPYRIDLAQLQAELTTAGVWGPLQKLSGALYLPIGQVEFAANREELQYVAKTKTALVEAFKTLLQEYLDDSLGALRDELGTGWDRRHKAVFLTSGLGFRLPKKYDAWAKHSVPLWDREKGVAPVTFTMYDTWKSRTHQIPIKGTTRILVHEPGDNRNLSGWSLNDGDTVIWPNEGHTREEAVEELEKLLKAVLLDGCPVGRLSERSWHMPDEERKRAQRAKSYKAKHKQRTFKMVGTASYGTLSENWEQTEPPQDQHVYFIIWGFKVRESTSFYEMVQKDMALAKSCGVEYPTIYGYKTTATKPVTDEDIEQGVPYNEWRKSFFKELWTAKRQQDLRDLEWSSLFQGMPYEFSRYYSEKDKDQNFLRNLPKLIARLTEALGDKHQVVRYFAHYRESLKTVQGWKSAYKDDLRTLAAMFPSRNHRTAPRCALDRILDAYPMLKLSIEDDNDMHVFMTHPDPIIGYIKSIDGAQL